MNIGIVGSAGEDKAIKFLKKNKYKIIIKNYQTYFGELDIVCQKEGFIIFVEVKTRSENYMVSGRDAVSPSKQKKIIKAAMQYLQTHKTDLQPRFDVVEITLKNGKDEIVHIENAFTVGGYHGFI